MRAANSCMMGPSRTLWAWAWASVHLGMQWIFIPFLHQSPKCQELQQKRVLCGVRRSSLENVKEILLPVRRVPPEKALGVPGGEPMTHWRYKLRDQQSRRVFPSPIWILSCVSLLMLKPIYNCHHCLPSFSGFSKEKSPHTGHVTKQPIVTCFFSVLDIIPRASAC